MYDEENDFRECLKSEKEQTVKDLESKYVSEGFKSASGKV